MFIPICIFYFDQFKVGHKICKCPITKSTQKNGFKWWGTYF